MYRTGKGRLCLPVHCPGHAGYPGPVGDGEAPAFIGHNWQLASHGGQDGPVCLQRSTKDSCVMKLFLIHLIKSKIISVLIINVCGKSSYYHMSSLWQG